MSIDAYDVYDELAKLLPDSRYMDPPDGGNTHVLEQVKRMVNDYKAQRDELLAMLNKIDDKARQSATIISFASSVTGMLTDIRGLIDKCENS